MSKLGCFSTRRAASCFARELASLDLENREASERREDSLVKSPLPQMSSKSDRREAKLARRELGKLKRVATKRLKRRLQSECGFGNDLEQEVRALGAMAVEISRSSAAAVDKTRDAQVEAVADLLQPLASELTSELPRARATGMQRRS